MVTLYNVIDTRIWHFYSVVVVKEKNVKWFIPAEPPEAKLPKITAEDESEI